MTRTAETSESLAEQSSRQVGNPTLTNDTLWDALSEELDTLRTGKRSRRREPWFTVLPCLTQFAERNGFRPLSLAPFVPLTGPLNGTVSGVAVPLDLALHPDLTSTSGLSKSQ
jgi:hypothetical protein